MSAYSKHLISSLFYTFSTVLFGQDLKIITKDITLIDRSEPVYISNLRETDNDQTVIEGKSTSNIIVLSGKVTSTSKRPIYGAKVIATFASQLSGYSTFVSDSIKAGTLEDSKFGFFSNIAAQTETDCNGDYKIYLSKGGKYIITAFAEGYLLQYYK